MAAHNILVLLLVFVTCHVTYAAILRPDWFPYFRDEPETERGVTMSARQGRNSLSGMNCPPDISETECYHELMAVWTRVLAKDKRNHGYAVRGLGLK